MKTAVLQNDIRIALELGNVLGSHVTTEHVMFCRAENCNTCRHAKASRVLRYGADRVKHLVLAVWS